jgi:hypothetical protein
MDELIEAIEAEIPGGRGLITHEPEPLPFPSAVETTGIEAIGDAPVTPLRDAVRRTAEIFRHGIERGTLDPEAHGLEAVAGPA